MNYEIKPIRSEKDYNRAMEIIKELFQVPDGSPEADILDILIVLVSDYERKTLPKNRYPSLSYAIQYELDEKNINLNDLAEQGLDVELIELLIAEKILPTLEQARLIHKLLSIPVEWILAEFENYIIDNYPKINS